MNGGTRLDYYNYTIEVKILHIYFVSFILHLDANLFYLFIICLFIYHFVYLFIYIYIYLFICVFIHSFTYLFIYYLGI